ncbi:MAG TPA: ABC transporter ATP-binding protein [Anaerolineales bacterium]|nr:ABC transporter ATP-binding protein [Anaerolineales bacterium]
MTDSDTILVARNLSMKFTGTNGGLPALDRVSLSVRSQEFVCVVGPSGCGKTTLLRLLSGLLMPTDGRVDFAGQPLVGPRRRIGFVFQQANLMPWRNVLDNIALPLELEGSTLEARHARAHELIELVGLQGFETVYPRDLSGGMAQRVAIARALIHRPELLLLDEPFGSLDALTRERMASELMRIWSRHAVTVIMVTHSISEAVLLADRVIVLSPRPGSLRLEVAIPLPRPRTLDMSYTPEFGLVADKIRKAIEGA